jgi:GST-like protein
MIDFYTWSTPNGIKVSIMLEEIGEPYKVIAVDIGAGAQFEPAFLEISPNNKIPAIVDHHGPDGKSHALFESGAILMYLAEKSGQLMPSDLDGRFVVIQWLMFQMGHIGPMLGQAHHFRGYAPEKLPYAIDRYTNEARRLYGVLDKRLGAARYLGGERYSIADIATFPWIRSHKRQGQDLNDFLNVKRWFDEIASRPAVQRGIEVLKDLRREFDAKAHEYLFGARQYHRTP